MIIYIVKCIIISQKVQRISSFMNVPHGVYYWQDICKSRELY